MSNKAFQDLALAALIAIIVAGGVLVGLVGADLTRYTSIVISDGDTLNDWLSHLPSFLRYPTLMWGELVWAVITWLG